MTTVNPEPFLRSLFEAFRRDGVAYLVLRNYENLPADPGNDLDVFMASSDFEKGLGLIRRAARETGWRLLVELSPMGNRKFYWRPPEARGRVLIMDVFQGIFWKGVPVASAACLVGTRRDYRGLSVAAPGAECAVTLMKELLMFGEVKRRGDARPRLQRQAGEDAQTFRECLEPCFGARWTGFLLERTRAGDWAAVEAAHQRLRASAAVRGLVRSPLSQVGRWIRFLADHIMHRVRRPMGFFLVLLGPDGSGKTTLAEAVAGFWVANIHKEVAQIHGDFRIMPRLKGVRRLAAKLGGGAVPDVDFTARHSGSSVRPHSRAKALLYLGYYLWDFVLGHAVISAHRMRDRLIVADRYFDDYFLQPAWRQLPRRLLHAARRLIPQPDLVVCIERPAEAIYASKQELTVAEIQRQQEALRILTSRLPNAVMVKADKGPESTADDVVSLLMDRLENRSREA